MFANTTDNYTVSQTSLIVFFHQVQAVGYRIKRRSLLDVGVGSNSAKNKAFPFNPCVSVECAVVSIWNSGILTVYLRLMQTLVHKCV